MITNEPDARDVAARIVGVEGQHPVNATTEELVIPFVTLDHSRKGSRVYTVNIAGERLALGNPATQLPFDLYAKVHDSGAIAVYSHALPRGAEAAWEKELTQRGETYAGTPDSTPAVSLKDALNIIIEQGVTSPLLARGLVAYLVVHSRQRAQVPAWDIALRGHQPRPAHGPHADRVPAWQRCHFRHVIDAERGRLLFTTNTLATGPNDPLGY